MGPRRLSAQLLRSSVRVAPSTIHRLLQRTGLGSRHERLAVLAHHTARSAGLLTDRTRRRLWQARYGRARHIQAEVPGDLACLDCFYIGKLKGVGKLWQVTACDAAHPLAFRFRAGPWGQIGREPLVLLGGLLGGVLIKKGHTPW